MRDNWVQSHDCCRIPRAAWRSSEIMFSNFPLISIAVQSAYPNVQCPFSWVLIGVCPWPSSTAEAIKCLLADKPWPQIFPEVFMQMWLWISASQHAADLLIYYQAHAVQKPSNEVLSQSPSTSTKAPSTTSLCYNASSMSVTPWCSAVSVKIPGW